MTINTQKLKRYRKQICNWCWFPLAFIGSNGKFHAGCSQRPDYHDWERYWAWMSSPGRSRFGSYGRRVLTEEEQREFDLWSERNDKLEDVKYD